MKPLWLFPLLVVLLSCGPMKCPTVDYNTEPSYPDYLEDILDLEPTFEAKIIKAAKSLSADPDTFKLHSPITGYRSKVQFMPSSPRPAVERSDGTWYYSSIEVKYLDGSVRQTDPEGAEYAWIRLKEHPERGCQIERAFTPIFGP